MSVIRVLIADDHALVRESVKAILANEVDIKIVATASDGQEAVELFKSHHPDVIVMDISMPSMDGLHATELIHRAQSTINIVILSMHVNAALVQQARWLHDYPTHTITIEGHADERGTREYNIALGAKRAETVKAFLTGRGVASARIRTLSYGKERPVASCNDISCWSQNRRAHTRLAVVAIGRS